MLPSKPTTDLNIQAEPTTIFCQSLEKIGFSSCSVDESAESLSSSDPGIFTKGGENYVVLHASTVIYPKQMVNLWEHKYFHPDHYLPGYKNAPMDKFTTANVLANFLFPALGNYIDQAAGQLVFLGHPFFFHHRPGEIYSLEKLPPLRGHRHAVVVGHWNHHINKTLTALRMVGNQTHKHPSTIWLFLDSDHPMFLDSDNPILKEFHLVPINISTIFCSLLEFHADTDQFGRALHKHCSKNNRQLHKC